MMTIVLSPGHLVFIGSAIVFGTSLCFHLAYYLGRFTGRLESVERHIVELRDEFSSMKAGA